MSFKSSLFTRNLTNGEFNTDFTTPSVSDSGEFFGLQGTLTTENQIQVLYVHGTEGICQTTEYEVILKVYLGAGKTNVYDFFRDATSGEFINIIDKECILKLEGESTSFEPYYQYMYVENYDILKNLAAVEEVIAGGGVIITAGAPATFYLKLTLKNYLHKLSERKQSKIFLDTTFQSILQNSLTDENLRVKNPEGIGVGTGIDIFDTNNIHFQGQYDSAGANLIDGTSNMNVFSTVLSHTMQYDEDNLSFIRRLCYNEGIQYLVFQDLTGDANSPMATNIVFFTTWGSSGENWTPANKFLGIDTINRAYDYSDIQLIDYTADYIGNQAVKDNDERASLFLRQSKKVHTLSNSYFIPKHKRITVADDKTSIKEENYSSINRFNKDNKNFDEENFYKVFQLNKNEHEGIGVNLQRDNYVPEYIAENTDSKIYDTIITEAYRRNYKNQIRRVIGDFSQITAENSVYFFNIKKFYKFNNIKFNKSLANDDILAPVKMELYGYTSDFFGDDAKNLSDLEGTHFHMKITSNVTSTNTTVGAFIQTMDFHIVVSDSIQDIDTNPNYYVPYNYYKDCEDENEKILYTYLYKFSEAEIKSFELSAKTSISAVIDSESTATSDNEFLDSVLPTSKGKYNVYFPHIPSYKGKAQDQGNTDITLTLVTPKQNDTSSTYSFNKTLSSGKYFVPLRIQNKVANFYEMQYTNTNETLYKVGGLNIGVSNGSRVNVEFMNNNINLPIITSIIPPNLDIDENPTTYLKHLGDYGATASTYEASVTNKYTWRSLVNNELSIWGDSFAHNIKLIAGTTDEKSYFMLFGVNLEQSIRMGTTGIFQRIATKGYQQNLIDGSQLDSGEVSSAEFKQDITGNTPTVPGYYLEKKFNKFTKYPEEVGMYMNAYDDLGQEDKFNIYPNITGQSEWDGDYFFQRQLGDNYNLQIGDKNIWHGRHDGDHIFRSMNEYHHYYRGTPTHTEQTTTEPYSVKTEHRNTSTVSEIYIPDVDSPDSTEAQIYGTEKDYDAFYTAATNFEINNNNSYKIAKLGHSEIASDSNYWDLLAGNGTEMITSDLTLELNHMHYYTDVVQLSLSDNINHTMGQFFKSSMAECVMYNYDGPVATSFGHRHGSWFDLSFITFDIMVDNDLFVSPVGNESYLCMSSSWIYLVTGRDMIAFVLLGWVHASRGKGLVVDEKPFSWDELSYKIASFLQVANVFTIFLHTGGAMHGLGKSMFSSHTARKLNALVEQNN